MRRKSLNLLSLILITAFFLFNLTACFGSSSSSSNSKSKSTSSTNSKYVGDDSNGVPISATTRTLKVNSLPSNTINSNSAIKPSTVNKIAVSTTTAINTTLAPAVNVSTETEYRDAIINSLSKGENISVNLQGNLKVNTIGDVTMKLIETSGYSGYISGIQYGIQNNVAYIIVAYKGGTASYLNKINAVDAKVQQIVSSVTNADMSDYEKELALHDYLVNNTSYDYDNYVNGTLPDDSFTAYGALIKGIAVCEGYSEAMYKLLNAAGVRASIITGKVDNEPHAWNLVNISGAIYHVDATFDDPPSKVLNILTHSYFNVNDSQISKDHSWIKADYPQSTAIGSNYFVVNDLVANNASKYYQIVKNEITKKNTIINVRTNTYDSKTFSSDVVYKIIKENNMSYVDTTKGIGFDYDKNCNVITILINYY